MKPHKWAKEIKAWADGAEIEWCYMAEPFGIWQTVTSPNWDSTNLKYRIKPQPSGCLACVTCGQLVEQPQPKEPQYLYVYLNDIGNTVFLHGLARGVNWTLIGKIKLENEDAI